MKLYPLILILLCFGCRTLDKKIVRMSAMSKVEPASVIQPATITPSLLTANASWAPVFGAASYAFCYGPESHRYLTIIRSDATNCTANLIAGGTYYCAVTAITSDNFGSDFSDETVVTMPLAFDIYFPNPGILQSSTDLVNWTARDAAFDGIVYRVSDPKWPNEFYRTTTTK